MSLKETLQEDVKQAMKDRDQEKLSVLRMVMAAVKNAEIEKQTELSDEQIEEVVGRQVKQLQDSMKDFEAGGRDDLLKKAHAERTLLQTYLPEQLSDEELEAIVDKIIADMGTATSADMGKIMGVVMGQAKGRTDGNRVRAIVQKKLS
jgi:hypothetical protein